jgi:prevent-host-death family protein
MVEIIIQFFCKLTMYKTVRSTTLRENLREILDSLSKGENYLVTKRGKPVGGIVNPSLFEDLLALSSPSYLKSIKESREQYKKGQYYTLEEVLKDLEIE